MSTPGGIGVYTSGSGLPSSVSERPWRGVYHHRDGYPEGLGQHLIEFVAASRGDLPRVVRSLIDESPYGWSSCLRATFDRPEGRYGSEDMKVRVSHAFTTDVAFVYVFDVEARRLDAYATHADADGELIATVTFWDDGRADPPTLTWA